MQQLDQQVARRLTRFYVIALTIIALMTLSGLLFIKHTINTHYDDGRVVNVAGRQRMLSQRLTKLAVLKIEAIRSADIPLFDSLLTTWRNTHVQLRNGTLLMEKPYAVRKSSRLDSMFAQIDPAFQSMYTGFVRISNPAGGLEQQRAALAVILRDEPSFLRQMNDIVFQFDAESFTRVKYLEQVEWILGIATLLTVFIEGLFIFRPVVSHTKQVIRRLAASEEALRLANEQLEITNRSLAVANQQLIETQAGVLRLTKEKHQLQRAEDMVRSAALLEGQEEERKRFARELHDGIGQMLTGLKLHAGKIRKFPFSDEKQQARFDELCNLIQDTIQATRQVSHNLMPSVLSDFGLDAALQLLADQTAQLAGTAVVFTKAGRGKRLSPVVEIGLYRIAQEALHNAVKYAGAQTIRIHLEQESQRIRLAVEDDGRGFTIRKSRNGKPLTNVNGLENMRTRTQLMNGDFTITSKPKKGTQVSVVLALSDNQLY
ncbi:ATP-binding protein [Nibrella viscosa]